MTSQLIQKTEHRRTNDDKEEVLRRIDSDDVRKNWLFTATIIFVIGIAFWLVLINPFNSYLPEFFFVVSCISLFVISYLNKRELGLNSLGHIAYVVVCLIVGLGLTFGLYVSSSGELLEQSVLLQTFNKHQEKLSEEQINILKTDPNNLMVLRTITINFN